MKLQFFCEKIREITTLILFIPYLLAGQFGDFLSISLWGGQSWRFDYKSCFGLQEKWIDEATLIPKIRQMTQPGGELEDAIAIIYIVGQKIAMALTGHTYIDII